MHGLLGRGSITATAAFDGIGARGIASARSLFSPEENHASRSVLSRPAVPRRMYPWVPLAIGLAVFAGFAQTYYLKFAFAQPAMPLLVHLHGLLMSAWVMLFASQTWLVAPPGRPAPSAGYGRHGDGGADSGDRIR